MLSIKHFYSARNISRFSKVLYQPVKPKDVETTSNDVEHKEHQIKIQKLKLNDKLLSNLMLMVKSKKRLEKGQQIVVEGKTLISEAVQAHFKLNYLLFSHSEKISDVLSVMGQSAGSVNFIKVPQQDLTFWSVLTTCPGVIGIFDKPKPPMPKKNALPITVICDNVREPNNLGAVIRLANALPANKVLLPKGCADPWDVKAIRGSSGSIFHMPTEDSLTWQQIDDGVTNCENSIVLIADNDVSKYLPSSVVPYDEISEDLIGGRDIYLLIGGETKGISDEAKYFASKRAWKVINIPLDAAVNSLNISNALAIVLFELRRKLSRLH